MLASYRGRGRGLRRQAGVAVRYPALGTSYGAIHFFWLSLIRDEPLSDTHTQQQVPRSNCLLNSKGAKWKLAIETCNLPLDFIFIIVKKTILGLLLGLLSASATAEWTLITSNDELDVYVDAATSPKVNSKAKTWVLSNYKTEQKNESLKKLYWSTKGQFEYDCAEVKLRILALLQFSEPMGGGQVLYQSTDVSNWTPLPPESIGFSLWQSACGKKQ